MVFPSSESLRILHHFKTACILEIVFLKFNSLEIVLLQEKMFPIILIASLVKSLFS